MHYLICDRCNGYYKLHKGESKQDFLCCSCGGNLVYSKEIPCRESNENLFFLDQDYPYHETSSCGNISNTPPKRRLSYGFYVMVVLILFISLAAATSFPKLFTSTNNSTNTIQIGFNSYGYVDKYVYTGSESSNMSGKKIAIITGIHPREKLSKTVWTDLLKNYTVHKGFQIVQYDINVVDNPNDFSVGRTNGELLASTFILPEMLKYQYDLIIVCHDHEPGYGEGFFIATPRMDAKSVNFAESLTQKLKTFNYYKNNHNSNEGSSNIHFTNYLVQNGYRTVVYEMPGLSSYNDAQNMTKSLIDDSFQILGGN